MTTEQVVKKSKSAWRMLLIGFLLGVLASFMALVFIAFKWGPQGESSEVDLYSGNTITYKFFLSKRSQISEPNQPHVQWAIQHQDPVRSWYVFAANVQRVEWFGDMQSVESATRSYVYEIHSLQIPEEEKVNLLHQYHKDLDTLKLKLEKYRESFSYKEPLEQFHTNWEKKLEEIEAADK